ncbi:MAG: DUF1566 domain-containing protein [Bacteroidetes bacterium]|nr:DUF1566 domain-containing protein [Bacteroidota bacterium]
MRRKKLCVCVLLMSITLLIFLTGCNLFGPENGTITIILIGADDHNGMHFYYRLSNCASITLPDDDPSVQSGSVVINDGRVEIIITDTYTQEPYGSPKEFEGDECFTVSGFIDADNSGADPAGGVDYVLKNSYSGNVDGDMTVNLTYPDNFILSDNGYAEMALYEEDGSMLMRGQLNTLGSAYVNVPMEYEFTIRNTGTALLKLGGSPLVALSGAASDVYSVSSDPGSVSLMPDETTTFTLQFLASITGSNSAIVTIPCNDFLANSYRITFSVLVEEPTAPLPKTGQTTSYTTGDDGDINSGVEWPAVRFVNNGDGTVTDLLTGLMWQGAPPYSTYSSNGYEWTYAVDPYVNNCSLGGYTDWHLPNVNELMSMVHAGENGPAAWLNSIDGFSGIRSDDYWTATLGYSDGFASPMGWVVDMSDGLLGRQNSSSYGSFAMIWVVRESSTGTVKLPKTGKTANFKPKDDGSLELGVAWPYPRFIINDGLVFDALTGLLWKQEPYNTAVTWEDAMIHAENLDYGGYSDWRLPNRNEMRSLVSYGASSNDMYLSGKFDTTIPEGRFWWTSTTYASPYGSSRAWVIYLDTGNSVDMPKTDKHYCWVVRDP